jgi:hypothetical protein
MLKEVLVCIGAILALFFSWIFCLFCMQDAKEQGIAIMFTSTIIGAALGYVSGQILNKKGYS